MGITVPAVASLMSEENSVQAPEEAATSGSMTARQTSATTGRRKDVVDAKEGARQQKAEFQKMQKQKENTVKHERMLAQREKDEAAVKERGVRSYQIREKKFRDMMEDIRSSDS